MDYQNNGGEYTNAEAYDRRNEFSVLENYVLGLWRPFLKEKITELSGDKIVVDLGCGTCEYATAAKTAKKIYAVDISEEMLGACRKKLENFKQAEIINASIENFTLSDGADLVITIGIWEYINPEKLFLKIKEITHQGNKIIVVFPNIYNYLNWTRSIAKWRKTALRPGFIKKLFENDFNLIDSASFGTVFWFPKKLQFLARPVWRSWDLLWKPIQRFLPIGINVYYLFERK